MRSVNDTEMEEQLNKLWTAEDFDKAANGYKLAESWDRAGETYEQLADCHLKLDSKHEAARAYVKAAQCYKNTHVNDSIYCFEQAIDLFRDVGKLNMVARFLREIAELYEAGGDIEQSCLFYERAADVFQDGEAYECKLKVAKLAAKLRQYLKAITIFEELAKHSMKPEHRVEHLFNVGICHLFDTSVIVNPSAFEQIYQKLDPSFVETRQYKVLMNIAAAIAEEDAAKFTSILRENHKIKRLDSWQASLFLRLKLDIKTGETDDEATDEEIAFVHAHMSALLEMRN